MADQSGKCSRKERRIGKLNRRFYSTKKKKITKALSLNITILLYINKHNIFSKKHPIFSF